MLGCMLFIVSIFANISIKQIMYLNPPLPKQINQVMVNSYCCPGRPSPDPLNYMPRSNSSVKELKLKVKELKEKERINMDDFLEELFGGRLNINSAIGRSSFEGRIKAIKVSLINSYPKIWFGNGAGTSQKLLPEMINVYDKTVARNSLKKAGMDRIPELLMYKFIFQKVKWNVSLIDSHNLFLTEFFNVGIIGASALLIMVCLILYRQLRRVIKNNNNNDVMNELLFATLLSMLAHRMTGSFVAIPFLWFFLGLSLGVSKLQFSPHQN
jgi:hypothetical protein